MTSTMPVVFLGHGSPMNALEHNAFTAAWRRLGREMPRPRAILAISAHWYRPGTAVAVAAEPRTIHDFRGFPPELYELRYPAPGDPALAHRVHDLLAPVAVALDASWGLDHGTWSVLRHVYPAADIPVVQLAIDATAAASVHYELGRALAPLRDEGVLIAASGNVVHNLRTYAWDGSAREPYEWAHRFEAAVKAAILVGDHAPLVGFEQLGPDAALSIPTPEHFLPLLYVLGAARAGDAAGFPVEGVVGGSLSMLSVRIG